MGPRRPPPFTLRAFRRGRGGVGPRPRPGGTRKGGVRPDRRLSPSQRAARGCHREVTEGRLAAPRAPVPGAGPRAGEAVWISGEARTRMARTAASALRLRTRLGGRGVAVFSWSPPAPPLSLWRLSRARLSLCRAVGWGETYRLSLLIKVRWWPLSVGGGRVCVPKPGN